MKLELTTYPVTKVQWSHQTCYRDGLLEIDKAELLATVLEDKKIISADLDIALPGEETRIVNVRDVVEARIKVTGPGCVFPGILGPVETVEPGATSEETHIPVTDGVWIVEGLTSDEALERCSQRWGDEQKGMCLAPGGATYYVWLEPNTVMEVVIDNDPTHPWQQHFLAAVLGIIDDRDDILQERRGRWRYWLTADLGALGVIPGCASVLGCIAALGAIALGGGELIQSDARIAGFEASLCTHSRDAVFNYCMMRGNDDAACREAAGYGEPCTPGRIGGPPVGCNPRAPCMPR